MSCLTACEIERSARILLRRHGPAAPQEARRQAETCAGGGQRHWVATWLLIAEICEELLSSGAGPVTHPAG
ncbi:hypothetical protein KXS07_21350 [Inquilinus limosus]|uniref:hypothetical protein n=1 Tax=Inquilinus limosus TaxID=171674 RepID=UPI0004134C87|nr:hypothetical protein [Inquilinus limosus]